MMRGSRERVEDMTIEYYSKAGGTSSSDADKRVVQPASGAKHGSAVPNGVILKRSNWSKFLTGTAVALPAQFQRR